MTDVPTPTRQQVEALHEHWQRLGRQGAPHTARIRAMEDWRRACDRLVAHLARSRGWIVARTTFSVEQLCRAQAGRYRDRDYLGEPHLRVIDHPEYFRWPTRPFRPAAILTHAYLDVERIQSFAAAHGLACEILPWSWYYPGGCTAALLSPRNNVLRFRRRPAPPRPAPVPPPPGTLAEAARMNADDCIGLAVLAALVLLMVLAT